MIPAFDEVLALVAAARHRAFQAVNAELAGTFCELAAAFLP